ncbi:MAG: PIN domain nuclease [Candidatus Bipolaricaulia bacterium]
MVIVDTTVWIDYFRGVRTPQTIWLNSELERQRLGITDLVLCEVLQGIRDDRQFSAVRRELLKLEVFTTGGVELALAAAQNYRTLRAQGYTVRRTIDCLIATLCLLHDHMLLHNDRDFEPFERVLGLRVLRPL